VSSESHLWLNFIEGGSCCAFAALLFEAVSIGSLDAYSSSIGVTLWGWLLSGETTLAFAFSYRCYVSSCKSWRRRNSATISSLGLVSFTNFVSRNRFKLMLVKPFLPREICMYAHPGVVSAIMNDVNWPPCIPYVVGVAACLSGICVTVTAMTHCTTSHCFLLSLHLFVNAAHQSLEGDIFLHINHQYKHVQTSHFQFLDEHLSNLKLMLTAIFDCTTSHCFYLSLHLFANVAHQSLEVDLFLHINHQCNHVQTSPFRFMDDV